MIDYFVMRRDYLQDNLSFIKRNRHKEFRQRDIQKMTTTVPDLENYKQRIEKLGTNYQIEILNILVRNGAKINENKTGVRLNMGILWKENRNVWGKVVEYLEYAEEKESRLEQTETEKQEITSFYFS